MDPRMRRATVGTLYLFLPPHSAVLLQPPAAGKMPVTVSKEDGVTVITVVYDPNCPRPPLCQIRKGLYFSSGCCSVPQHLRKVQPAPLTVLGTLHIMIGLLSLSLNIVLVQSDYWQMFEVTGFFFGTGPLFVVFGLVCILSERFPCPCLVISNVVLNLVGIIVAIVATVFYIFNILRPYPPCGWYDGTSYSDRECSSKVLFEGIGSVLIVLSVLELCVTISSAVLAIKVLKSLNKEEDSSSSDPETTESSYENYIVYN